MHHVDGSANPRPFASLMDRLRAGEIDRRAFLRASTALGVTAGMATFCANSVTAGGGRNGFAFYQGADGTLAASPADSPVAGAPEIGMESTARGEGGELRTLLWQAPTMAAPHSAAGTKDFMAAALVLEPLMHYLPDGTIIPNLVTAVPSVENGSLAEDLSSATFTLLPDVTWSDGEPFTANDVVFTWQWITNPDNAAVTIAIWEPIAEIVAEDELTARVTFKAPAATWFAPFVGGLNGPIYPAHAFVDENDPNPGFLTAPIGTGPFVIESFSPNDEVRYVANENYREPNKPYFASVFLKGGGDAPSAARAVLETGEFDYAWNLQIEPAILQQMSENSSSGKLIANPTTSVERIHFNFSDPHTEVDGQRSEMNTPHPFLTDKAVRQAMNKAVQRDVIANEFYGPGQPPTANILTGLPSFDSPNTSWEFDLEEAAQILEEAGWVLDGDVRVKDGVALELTYSTSVNSVRQKTQAVVKDAFNQIGIGVQLMQVDAGIFFDSSAGNDQNSAHMYWDMDMWTNSPDSPIPTTFMTSWYAGPNRENIAQASNQWQGQNYQRWVNEDFDALYDDLLVQTDPEAAANLLVQMNDLLIEEVVVIPEVNRGGVFAIASDINEENIASGPGFELTFWNIANWNRVEE